MRAVLKPWLIKSVAAVCVGFVALLSVVSPLGAFLESTLTLHMILQHFLYIAGGFLLVYGADVLTWVGSRLSKNISGVYSMFLKANSILGMYGTATLIAASSIIAYWYLPSNFDAGLLKASVHFEMHLSLVVAGGLIYVGSKFLTRRANLFAPVIVAKAMGLFGALMLVTPTAIYSVYPLTEQTETGVVSVIIMLVVDLTLMPILLYNYFGRGIHVNSRI